MTKSDTARQLLKDRIERYSEGGQVRAARELGFSPSLVSQYLKGKYPGNVSKVEERIVRLYREDFVQCPVMGAIEPGECAETYNRAVRIGAKAGNPTTCRLYVACRQCSIRNIKEEPC